MTHSKVTDIKGSQRKSHMCIIHNTFLPQKKCHISHLFEGRASKLFIIILHWCFVCSLLIYSSFILYNHLFTSTWIHVYLLFTLSYFEILLSSIFCSTCSEFVCWGAFSVGPCAPLTYPHQCGMLVVEAVVLPYLLAQDAPGSSCRFPVSNLELAISPRSSSSFYYIMV